MNAALRFVRPYIELRKSSTVLTSATVWYKIATCVNGSHTRFRYYHRTLPNYKKRKTNEEKKRIKTLQFIPRVPEKKVVPVIDVWNDMKIADLVHATKRSIDEVLTAISFCSTNRHNYNSNTIISNMRVSEEIVKKLGYKSRSVSNPDTMLSKKKDLDAVKRPPPDPTILIKRHPIVTVMGHVDHGKTTLLDSLRKTSVVLSEFGGITQHIGAFNVTLETGERMTFLDTPGHAAFNAMRARGARITDIVVLVVAADDGVMEQTVQSIEMAKSANVPIVVAINKIDKHNADIRRTQKMLAINGIQVEDQGGDVQSVNISALKGVNLNALVECIAAQAEVMNLTGDPTGLVEAVVVEASCETGRGKVATVLIQRGTLRPGAVLVSGVAWAKVRAMFDEAGKPVREARLAEAVEVIGWRVVPDVGDEILQVESERRAGEVVAYRRAQLDNLRAIEQDKAAELKYVDYREEYKANLEKRRKLGVIKLKKEGPRKKESLPDDDTPKVNVLIKGDVAGSVEAIMDILNTYPDAEQCRLNVVHHGIGDVTQSDVQLAEAFNAIIYCFNVAVPRNLENSVTELKVSIREHTVIYNLIEDLKEEINGKLPPVTKDEILGEANVLQQFVVTEKRKKVNVAGCRCTKGVLLKTANFRVIRGKDTVIYEGKVESMRHLKEEVASIKNDTECGLRFEQPDVSVQPGDRLICFKIIQKEPETQWDPGF
ncbi:translation initiation factor IF-2, mitochondrial [Orussus abietinus]|uniref:translation initiation factor IF-2, mitochondrial n=1 Tax=Orussus abietinus TaxID=222816 RepID=UPI0006250A4B|nr:translation initiation factor IF-2, mitochondrial [Orussus abietinus]